MIIDSLTYVGGPLIGPDGLPTKRKTTFFGTEELIQSMDRNGIDMSVAIPLFGDWEKDYMPQNEYIAQSQKEHPDRILGFCWLIPKLRQQALDDLDICINDLELKGVYLGPRFDGYVPGGWGFELLGPFYQKVSDLGVPLIVHCSGPSVLETPGMVFQIADTFPKIKMIITHLGAARMSGDVALLLKNYKNTYSETSETHSSFTVVGAMNTVGEDRLVFGSETPHIGPEIEKRKMDIALGLNLMTQEQYDLIMGRNMAKILDMKI